jgi:hypothetical protein
LSLCQSSALRPGINCKPATGKLASSLKRIVEIPSLELVNLIPNQNDKSAIKQLFEGQKGRGMELKMEKTNYWEKQLK